MIRPRHSHSLRPVLLGIVAIASCPVIAAAQSELVIYPVRKRNPAAEPLGRVR